MSRLRANYLTVPLSGKIAESDPHRAEIMHLHELAVSSDIPNYSDPQTGLSVLTAAFLATLNSCCASGCRHCPFEVE